MAAKEKPVRKMLKSAVEKKKDHANTNPNSPKGRAYDILGAHFKHDPKAAKKRFSGIKEGMHTKVYPSKKHSKEDLSKANAHMKKHGG